MENFLRVVPDVPSLTFKQQHPLLCPINFLYFTRTSLFCLALLLLIFTPYLILFHFVPFFCALCVTCILHFSPTSLICLDFLCTIFFFFSPPHFLPPLFPSSSPSLCCQCGSIFFSCKVHSLSAQSAQNIKRNSGFLLLKSHSVSIIS